MMRPIRVAGLPDPGNGHPPVNWLRITVGTTDGGDVPAQDSLCLVTGATGYTGSRLVSRLLDEGVRVRAMARNPDKLADASWRDDVEAVRGDLTEPDSLTAAFDGADVVYYLVHSMGTSKDFVAEVGEVLIDSGIETVVLQAGIVIGAGSASFEMIRHLTDRLPAMTTPKWVHNKIQPIAIGDVLDYLARAGTADVPKSRTWDVGGPDVMEYGDAMQVYAEVAGLRRRLIIVLPFLTPTIASWWVGLVTPIPSGLARPLVESLECDAVMLNHDIDGFIPPPDGGLTGYRDAVAEALQEDGTAASDGKRHLVKFSPAAPQ